VYIGLALRFSDNRIKIVHYLAELRRAWKAEAEVLSIGRVSGKAGDDYWDHRLEMCEILSLTYRHTPALVQKTV
jgi:hypothetical protein